MNRWLANTLGCCLIVALGLAVWGGFGLTRIAYTFLEKSANAVPAPKKADAELDSAKQATDDAAAEMRDVTIAMLKPCKKGKPETCGLIPAVRLTVQDMGDSVKVMQTQVAETKPLIENAANGIKDVSAAATDTLQQARTDLVTADGTIAAAQPVLVNLAATESDLDAAVNENRKEVSATLANVNLLAANTAGVMADVKVETDQMVKPKTKAQRIFSYAPVTLKLAAEVACLTTGTPCP